MENKLPLVLFVSIRVIRGFQNLQNLNDRRGLEISVPVRG
jgi:hypothetical protein